MRLTCSHNQLAMNRLKDSMLFTLSVFELGSLLSKTCDRNEYVCCWESGKYMSRNLRVSAPTCSCTQNHTVIRFCFVVKIFSYQENVRKYMYFKRINFTTKIFPRWLAPCYTQALP